MPALVQERRGRGDVVLCIGMPSSAFASFDYFSWQDERAVDLVTHAESHAATLNSTKARCAEVAALQRPDF